MKKYFVVVPKTGKEHTYELNKNESFDSIIESYCKENFLYGSIDSILRENDMIIYVGDEYSELYVPSIYNEKIKKILEDQISSFYGNKKNVYIKLHIIDNTSFSETDYKVYEVCSGVMKKEELEKLIKENCRNEKSLMILPPDNKFKLIKAEFDKERYHDEYYACYCDSHEIDYGSEIFEAQSTLIRLNHVIIQGNRNVFLLYIPHNVTAYQEKELLNLIDEIFKVKNTKMGVYVSGNNQLVSTNELLSKDKVLAFLSKEVINQNERPIFTGIKSTRFSDDNDVLALNFSQGKGK